MRLASSLLNIAVGGHYPGWCESVDELCARSNNKCCCLIEDCRTCTTCCVRRDRLPIGNGVWHIRNVVEVRFDDPDTGTLVPQAEWRLVRGGYVEHLGNGWPRCRRIYVKYINGGIPQGGDQVALKLVCALRKAWNPTEGHSCEDTPLNRQLRSVTWGGVTTEVDRESAKRSLLGVDDVVETWLAAMTMNQPKTPFTGAVVWWPSVWTRTTFRGL